jgi:hypothetical protein
MEEAQMRMKIGFGLTMLVLLAVDFLEFHDVFESKTPVEYMTGVVSVPILLLLFALFLGVLRLTRAEN